ncbi:MAG: TIGR03086 family metal-binding protein [Actinomycetota bacterium]|nr:TIGR03086 family metal-binding protein [Actinomycetota bacterium]
MTPPPLTVEQLSRALSAVGHLIAGIRDDQWSAPTPCTDWTVHDVVNHLVGVNLVFVALLNDQAPPERVADYLGDDPAAAYRDTGAAVRAAFEQPGVLERTYHGPLGAATGAERLHIRITDLLAHGWDLAVATGQSAELPEDLAEQSLAFARVQLSTMPRTGRFGPAQTVDDDAPAIDRLVAFLGRPLERVGR